VTALTGAGILAQGLGRSEEAIALNLRSIARDPLSSAAHNNLGSLYYESGRLAEAEAAFRASLELSPRRYGTRSFLAQVLMELGRGEEALAEAQQEPDETFRLLALVLIHHRSGRAKDSDSAVRELIEKYAAECPLQVAEAYGTRGEVDSAFEWLERALGERDAGLTHIKPNPHFRALRHDPRWPVFLAKLGLAD
jgi:tetratricopeptide (TPR) repeat protein